MHHPNDSPQPLKPLGTGDVTRPCPACGYDPRSLSTESKCPECGAAILDARFRTDLLRYADRHWVRRVYGGLCIVGIALVLLISIVAAQVLLLLIGVIILPRNTDSGLERIFELIRGGIATALALAALSVFGGAFAASIVEPRLVGLQRYFRTALMANHLVAAASVGLCWLALSNSMPSISVARLIAVHFCITSIALSVVGAAFQSLELERRSEVSSQNRIHTARGSIILSLICPVLFLALAWIGPLRWIDSSTWSPPGTSAFRPVLYGILFMWLVSMGILAKTRRIVKFEMELSPFSKSHSPASHTP